MEWYGMIMESIWSVPCGVHPLFHGFHMKGCINYDKKETLTMDSIHYSMGSMDSMDSIWSNV